MLPKYQNTDMDYTASMIGITDKNIKIPEIPNSYHYVDTKKINQLLQELKETDEKIKNLTEKKDKNPDNNALKELNIEKENILDDIYNCMNPFIESILLHYFCDYKDFHDDMYIVAYNFIKEWVKSINSEKNMEDQIFPGLYQHFVFFTKKQTK